MEAAPADVESQKRAAARRAVDLVRAGTVIGLGTGTTARYFIEGVGVRIREGLRIKAVATSEETWQLADSLGIPLVDDIDGSLDLDVDGADEIDADLNCIKGRGGALLREKMVAHASRRLVLIADERKVVASLGRTPVPIEVLPFLWRVTSRSIAALGGEPQLRMAGGQPFVTDNRNLVLDARFDRVDADLATALSTIPGVLGHGLFLGMAQGAIIGCSHGVEVMGRLE